MTPASVARMMAHFRKGTGTGPPSLLPIEILMWVAEEPRTTQELIQLTGAASAHVSVAIRHLTPWWSKKQQAVIRPRFWFLQRRNRPGKRGYRIHLTSAGRAFLASV